MGLIGYVYRNAELTTDCTNGGWSSRIGQVIIENADGPFTPESYTQYMPVRVVKHRTMNTLHVVSLTDLESGKWTMFGGNLLHCSDSRFSELIGEMLGPQFRYAVTALPIHDRIE